VKLGKVLFAIPTLFTLSSVFLGFMSVTCVLDGEMALAAAAILFAALFDMLDGKVARLTRTESRFGIQIDSLADVMSFGLAPAILVYEASLRELRAGSLDLGLAIAFLFVAAGALRLARFNVMAETTEGRVRRFVGLPIPMAAGTLASLVLALSHTGGVLGALPIALLVVLLSLLMVSSFTYRKSPGATRVSALLVLCPVAVIPITLAFIQPVYGFFGIYVYYILLGLTETAILRIRHRRAAHRRVEDPADEP